MKEIDLPFFGLFLALPFQLLPIPVLPTKPTARLFFVHALGNSTLITARLPAPTELRTALTMGMRKQFT